jgi:hypothetical protein
LNVLEKFKTQNDSGNNKLGGNISDEEGFERNLAIKYNKLYILSPSSSIVSFDVFSAGNSYFVDAKVNNSFESRRRLALFTKDTQSRFTTMCPSKWLLAVLVLSCAGCISAEPSVIPSNGKLPEIPDTVEKTEYGLESGNGNANKVKGSKMTALPVQGAAAALKNGLNKEQDDGKNKPGKSDGKNKCTKSLDIKPNLLNVLTTYDNNSTNTTTTLRNSRYLRLTQTVRSGTRTVFSEVQFVGMSTNPESKIDLGRNRKAWTDFNIANISPPNSPILAYAMSSTAQLDQTLVEFKAFVTTASLFIAEAQREIGPNELKFALKFTNPTSKNFTVQFLLNSDQGPPTNGVNGNSGVSLGPGSSFDWETTANCTKGGVTHSIPVVVSKTPRVVKNSIDDDDNGTLVSLMFDQTDCDTIYWYGSRGLCSFLFQ